MTPIFHQIKAWLRAATPSPLLHWYRHARLQRERTHNATQSVGKVFEQIYAHNRWGGLSGEFCSGSGSDPSFAARYCDVVRAFLADNNLTRVVDLGCGDFRVGQLLVGPALDYTGVDVVGPLIERNTREFARSGIRFACLDITRDPLPAGDVCLIRQVLQHLSNEQVKAILDKVLRQYRYAIITEHMPADGPWVRRNVDKPHGPDTRIADDSGLFLDAAPFSCQIEKVLLRMDVPRPLRRPGEQIVTMLIAGRAN